jgi:hypothetical protein
MASSSQQPTDRLEKQGKYNFADGAFLEGQCQNDEAVSLHQGLEFDDSVFEERY